MSTIALDTRIEQITREVKSSNTVIFRVGLWLGGIFNHRFSLSKWVTKRMINEIKKLTLLISESITETPDLSKEDAEKLYQLSKKSINRLIDFNEKLKEVDYLENEDLKISFEKCLDTFYVLEADAKLIAKSGSFKNTDVSIKSALSQKSKDSIESKLAQ